MQFSTQCTKTVVSINMTRSLLSTCLVLYRSRRSLLMKACRIVSLCSPWRDRVNLCRPMENYKTIGMYCNAICVPQCVFQRTQNTSKMELKQLNMPYKTELMLKAWPSTHCSGCSGISSGCQKIPLPKSNIFLGSLFF